MSTFIDDYSRFGYVYLMKQKSEAFEKFKELRTEVENTLGKRRKAIQFDRGGEYLLGDFKDYLIENGIVSQMTAPGTPQQNGVAERKNRPLLAMVRSMMSYSTLPISFWGYALNTAMYLLNLVPSKSIPNTLVELWNGRKPSMRHLHIWGCPAHVLKGKSNKLQSKTEVVFFIGYPKGTVGGLFYSHKDNKVFVSTNAKFLENDYMNDYTPRSRFVLGEMNGPVIEQPMDETRKDVVVSDTLQDITYEMTSTQELCRSGRIVRPPIRFIGLGETYEVISKEAENDPYTYEEAMNDKDAHH